MNERSFPSAYSTTQTTDTVKKNSSNVDSKMSSNYSKIGEVRTTLDRENEPR